MTAHQTKFFKRKEVSFPILLWIFGVSTLLVLHLFGVFSHAAPIADDNKVTVDGVENVGQYLTSLVLHAPSSSQHITIQYDEKIDALRVNGRINADALVIDAAQTNNNSSVQGNALFWWMANKVGGPTSNNLIVGGESNTINFATTYDGIAGRFGVSQGGNSVVVGSTKSEIRTSDNVLSMGTTNSSFSNKTENVAAIGGQVIAQAAKNSIAFWEGNKTIASNAVLLGKSINAGAKNQIFVWSDADAEFRPEQSSAFYVNTNNGFGLNTIEPRTKLDLANAGALKIVKTKPKYCSQNLAGVTSYAGDVFCGCNGKEWVPLTSDMTPQKVAACKSLMVKSCVGNLNTDPNSTNKWVASAYPRWNHESEQWEPIGWKYSSKDKLGACEYNCKIWFHPGANDPEGWLQVWACKQCSDVPNKFRWKTAGTWNDNCDFTCKASFKYANSSIERKCPDCEVGTYTENDNQDKTCKTCNKPVKLWRDKQGSNPYFSGFTTKGDGVNACDFDCAPRYQHFFNGKKSDKNNVSIGLNGTVNGNACIFCEIGTWSAGWKSKECTNCTNKPEQIEYSVNNVKYSLSNFSSYTSNGSANDCEWKCDASKGLEKNGNLCKCRANTHLEWGKCIANTMRAHCANPAPANDEGVIKGKSDYDRQWVGDRNKGSWSTTKNWEFVESFIPPRACQWSCKAGYKRSGNTCVKNINPQSGICEKKHYQCQRGLPFAKDTPPLVNGWAWKCSGIDGGKSSDPCLECDKENGYSWTNLGWGYYSWSCIKLIPNQCENTSFHQKSLLDSDFGKMVVKIDFGCSIRNITYQDTDVCWKKVLNGKVLGIFTGNGEVIHPNNQKIKFGLNSNYKNDKSSRTYRYDVYFWSEKKQSNEVKIQTNPCVDWSSHFATCEAMLCSPLGRIP